MKTVIANLSNHHIHISRSDLDTLFGEGYELRVKKDLLQPGQFAAEETVELIGPRSSIKKLRILGPVRKETQVEILASDVYGLGIDLPPTKLSGDLNSSAPIHIKGPKGEVRKNRGCIIAARHIHLDTQSALDMNLRDRQIVSVKAGVQGRKVIFNDVLVRVKANFQPECHLDFDEGNACGHVDGAIVEIID